MFDLRLSTGLEIVVRTTIIYFVILVGLRLSGKREIGQMTVFDLVVLLLIANVAQNAMVGPDTSLLGGILGASILLIINSIVARLRLSWPVFRHLVEGSPSLLVLHGKPLTKNMRREGIDEETLLTALREHGVATVAGVEMAVLEIDGTISIVPEGAISTSKFRPAKYLRHK